MKFLLLALFVAVAHSASAACCDVISVTGSGFEAKQSHKMGTFTKTAATQNGMPVYKNQHNQYLYYWSRSYKSWRIGHDYDPFSSYGDFTGAHHAYMFKSTGPICPDNIDNARWEFCTLARWDSCTTWQSGRLNVECVDNAAGGVAGKDVTIGILAVSMVIMALYILYSCCCAGRSKTSVAKAVGAKSAGTKRKRMKKTAKKPKKSKTEDEEEEDVEEPCEEEFDDDAEFDVEMPEGLELPEGMPELDGDCCSSCCEKLQSIMGEVDLGALAEGDLGALAEGVDLGALVEGVELGDEAEE